MINCFLWLFKTGWEAKIFIQLAWIQSSYRILIWDFPHWARFLRQNFNRANQRTAGEVANDDVDVLRNGLKTEIWKSGRKMIIFLKKHRSIPPPRCCQSIYFQRILSAMTFLSLFCNCKDWWNAQLVVVMVTDHPTWAVDLCSSSKVSLDKTFHTTLHYENIIPVMKPVTN